MQTGTGQYAHSKVAIFDWADNTFLSGAIDTYLAASSQTWAGLTGETQDHLRMPRIWVVTAAANGKLNDAYAVGTGFSLQQNVPFGPICLEDPTGLVYTGASPATVFLEV